jgi:hypothetical protein
MQDAIRQALAEHFIVQAPEVYRGQGAAEESPMPHVSASIMRSEGTLSSGHPPAAESEQISLFEMNAGMMLAAPIYTHQQIMVLGRGHVLTESVINRLLDIRSSLASPDIWVLHAAPGPAPATRTMTS